MTTNEIKNLPQNSKLVHLEGMRGLMALNVILCHFICIFIPQMYFTSFADGTFLSRFADTPLSALVNGDIAVTFFFALTGFLVARSQFIKETHISSLSKKMVSRYLKFLPVIAVAVLFTFLTMILDLQYHLQITDPRVNSGFLRNYCNFTPTLVNLIADIFLMPFVRSSAYVGPFWTILYEFWGYALAFLIAQVFKNNKWRRVWYVVTLGVLYLTINETFLTFVFGVIIADLCFNKNECLLNKYYDKLFDNKVFLIITLIFATYFACVPMNPCKLYFYWDYLPLGYRTLRGFGISLFIFVSIKLELIQKILSFKPLVFLGEISFETYALHWPIMLSLQCGLFTIFSANGIGYSLSCALSFIITLPVIYACSFLLRFTIKKIGTILSSRKNK